MMVFDTCKETDLCIVYGEPIRPKPIIHKRTEGQQKAHPFEEEQDVPPFRGGSFRASWEITVQTIPGAAKEQDVCIVGEENIWQNPNICVRRACLQETHSVENPIHSKLDSSVPSEPPAQTVADAAMGQDICIVYEKGVLQKPTIHIRPGYPEEEDSEEDISLPHGITGQTIPGAAKEQAVCIVGEENIWQFPKTGKRNVFLQETHSGEGPVHSKLDSSVPSEPPAQTVVDATKGQDIGIVYEQGVLQKPTVHIRPGYPEEEDLEEEDSEEDIPLPHGITGQTIPGAAKEQDVCIVGEENIWQFPKTGKRKVFLQETHSMEGPVHSKLDSSVHSEPPAQTVVDAAKGQDICIVYEQGVLQKRTIHIRTGYPEETHPREDIDMPIAAGGDSEGHSESTFQPVLDATKEQDTCVVYEELVSQKPIFQGRAPSEATAQRGVGTAGVVQWRQNRRKSLGKAQDEMVEQNYLSQDGPKMRKGSHTERKTDESIIPQSGFFTEQAEQSNPLRASTEDKTIQRAESGGTSSGSRNNGNSPTCPTEVKPFTCLECGMSFRKQKQFAIHQMIHTGQKPHKCAGRGKSYCTKWNLTVHKRTHTGEKPFKSTVCKKSFNESSNFTKHQRTHTGEKPFKCSVCEKSFTDKSTLTLHKRTHKREKPYKCPVCRKHFARCSNLTVHKRTHTGEKPYKCSVCRKRFTRRSTLTVHKRIHTGEKPYKCSVCRKLFARKSHLTVHKRTHTREKPFKCSVCDKSFTQRSNLTTHQRTHTREKPYKCSVCGKCFAQRSHLTVHKRTHTGEKPFKCSVCEKSFTHSSNLKVHKRTHTGKKPYKCSVCRKRFAQKSHLTVHKRTHTKETPNQGSNLSESVGDESRPHEGENAQRMETM